MLIAGALQQKILIAKKVSYSYYEVYTNTQRAFAGINFPYGADEDAAYIITWLELYNLNGIDLFCSFIEKFNDQYDYKIDLSKDEKKIDLKNKSNLMTGPGVIDYLVSKFKKNNENSKGVAFLCKYV